MFNREYMFNVYVLSLLMGTKLHQHMSGFIRG
jgi:hypothetical protein